MEQHNREQAVKACREALRSYGWAGPYREAIRRQCPTLDKLPQQMTVEERQALRDNMLAALEFHLDELKEIQS